MSKKCLITLSSTLKVRHPVTKERVAIGPGTVEVDKALADYYGFTVVESEASTIGDADTDEGGMVDDASTDTPADAENTEGDAAKGVDSLPYGHILTEHFSSTEEVAAASNDTLLDIEGIGPARLTQIREAL